MRLGRNTPTYINLEGQKEGSYENWWNNAGGMYEENGDERKTKKKEVYGKRNKGIF